MSEKTSNTTTEATPSANILDYVQIQKILSVLITIVGDVKLSEAKNWADVKANAEALKQEGHEPV